jgi:hypothetical protein
VECVELEYPSVELLSVEPEVDSLPAVPLELVPQDDDRTNIPNMKRILLELFIARPR